MIKMLLVISSIIIASYSPIIGLISISYLVITSVLITPLYLDIAACIAVIIAVLSKWHYLNYLHGSCLILLLPLGLRIIDHFYTKYKHRALILEYNSNIADSRNKAAATGTILGSTPGDMLVTVSDNDLNLHALVVGTTGVGKTTTMLNFVASFAQRNLPVIYLDGKGAPDLIVKLAAIAKEHQRVFKVFMLRPQSANRIDSDYLAGYNPFASGSATEWKNRIMALFSAVQNKGQEHFSLIEQSYVNLVARILFKAKIPIDLKALNGALENPGRLINLAREVDEELANKLINLYNDKSLKTLVSDVAKLLELFILSDYGYLFDTVKLDNVIKIRESILNGEIVLFLFDASAYPEDTNKLARMVINDINSSFASFNDCTKCLCIFDEFASYASANLADSISLHRTNGLHAVIGTQSLATVKLKNHDTARVAEELLACCNTYIIHRLNHPGDAEILARTMGTHKGFEVTTYFNHDTTSTSHSVNSNAGNIRMVDEFKLHPEMLKELKVGEAVIYNKVSQHFPQKIMIKSTQ